MSGACTRRPNLPLKSALLCLWILHSEHGGRRSEVTILDWFVRSPHRRSLPPSPPLSPREQVLRDTTVMPHPRHKLFWCLISHYVARAGGQAEINKRGIGGKFPWGDIPVEHQTLGFGGSVELSLTPPVTSAGPNTLPTFLYAYIAHSNSHCVKTEGR